MADDLNAVREDTNLYGLPHIVALVVYCVAEALLNGGVGIIKEAFCLCPIWKLDHLLLNHTVSDILERFPQLLMKRSFKGLFYNLIAA